MQSFRTTTLGPQVGLPIYAYHGTIGYRDYKIGQIIQPHGKVSPSPISSGAGTWAVQRLLGSVTNKRNVPIRLYYGLQLMHLGAAACLHKFMDIASGIPASEKGVSHRCQSHQPMAASVAETGDGSWGGKHHAQPHQTSDTQIQRKVYRLRNLPNHVDRLAAAELMADALNDASMRPRDIQFFSMASKVEPWKKWQVKVATLSFRKSPTVLDVGAPQWEFHVLGLSEPLILDQHFHGMTVLNDLSQSDHQYDCIAVSGLASHPFGSWQPKGGDRSFMWIRDTLPTSIPSVRFFLYGYDTSLVNSRSFQTILDLAGTLRKELEASDCAAPSARPLLFLVRSLGRVILKQLMVLLTAGNERSLLMLNLIHGAIFFGTPSVGMPIAHLRSIVADQPNQGLVQDISSDWPFLPSLEKQFNGYYARSGPSAIMVDRESATGGRCITEASSTIQIDEDHSHIVKFSPGDRRIAIFINKIHDICWPERFPMNAEQNHTALSQPRFDALESDEATHRVSEAFGSSQSDFVSWDYEVAVNTLRVPESDNRLNQIDERFGNTFSWAVDNQSIGLAQWNRRTAELLRSQQSASNQIIANFFFHHRETLQQKSFDGLLRSLLRQILEKEPRFRSMLGSIVETRLRAKVQDHTNNLKLKVEFFKGYLRICSSTGAGERDVCKRLCGDLERASRSPMGTIKTEALENWYKQIEPYKIICDFLKRNQFDLELCLFFDALDEYDGRPEAIAEFLEYVVREPPHGSRTRARTLSRVVRGPFSKPSSVAARVSAFTSTRRPTSVNIFLHQTLKEWAEAPTFKRTMLGNLASTTWENGRSFLVKYCLHPKVFGSSRQHRLEIFTQVQAAEKTSGVSQCSEAISRDSSIVENTREPLFLILLQPTYLLRHGFDITQDPRGFSEVMTSFWDSSDRVCGDLYMDIISNIFTSSEKPETLIDIRLPENSRSKYSSR
ncbi:hypothetical protein GQ53DRAFT_769210 [Thozetella sp. PMI_491]|nr:hypothetical protein GQ53DRAFT_769210 [Thozetella sp. PMI_491]